MNTSPSLPRPRHRWFAAVYDLMAKMDEKRARPMREFVAGQAAGRVLEVGCGTGLNLPYYDWSKVESLDATEPDSYMLRRAQARAATSLGEAGAKVRFHEAPAEALPFADASFDTVVATLVFCTVADPVRAVSEVVRVLKAGGQLRLMEHVRAEGIKGEVQKIVQPVYGWMAAGCQLHRDTEATIRAAGMELQVTERTSLGPLWPAFVGVATKPAPG